jgi:3-isopropylmalate dehydratase small subunit
MKFKGKVWKFGNNIDTDVIIPARYLNSSDPDILAQHCMEGIDINFSSKASKGDIIVAGKNFGCGSSREHAPIAIKALGISCVIARSFARLFYRNSFNMGLLILESPEVYESIREGDVLEVDIDEGKIREVSSNIIYRIEPIPSFMQRLIREGGLMGYAVNKLKNDFFRS